MTIDEIPADVLQELTPELDRLFRFGGCKPACHACKVELAIGDLFQLLSLDGTDEMTCNDCDRDALRAAHKRAAVNKERTKAAQMAWNLAHGGTGYSRPSVTAP